MLLAIGNLDLDPSDLPTSWLIGKPLAIVVLVLVGVVARWLMHRMVDRVVAGATSGALSARIGKGRNSGDVTASSRHGQRVRTMGSLIKSIVTGVVFTVVVVMVVSELGYDVAPILAGAGILGVAIGFGSQTLVKDFLSGIFMIFEDQYGVGDVVDLGDATGTVEAVSLRVTRIRAIDGTVWYVRNGEIARVGNMSQNWARTVLDIPVGYNEDLARVRAVLAEVGHELWDDHDYRGDILEQPEVWGVQSLDADSVLVRVVLKTVPGQQWLIARAMRERVKDRFDAEGIEIPLPQRVVWQRSEESVAV
ncbi:mechanosensitive ion channel family protein [Nocardioides mangrovicus]|uniref:Mechanosensitive ion channel family protein n=1 Tax=Nocardioides mangrovicus TaxID=2478913 RepID=A0A3L8P306_9ACTN|nr:mechanosensitive ion channel family protein [Nocardioides mangrovicus]RLV49720.1 mechanosensitive ion channel family protein [Nocardioides mangrovicus]